MKLVAGAASHVGKIRTNNEDAFLVDVDLGLFAVADGMGGERAGEIASHLALETLRSRILATPDVPPSDALRAAIEAAHAAVLEAASADPAKAKMGTTITALLIHGERAVVGHVGDSRLYRVRWGQVAKLTDDHTAVAALVKAGAVREEEAHDHPWAHILSQVVGGRGKLEVQVVDVEATSGDRFVLCSDGFSDSLTDPQWLTLLDAKPPIETAAELVARAVDLDGRDNATAVVVALGDDGRRKDRQSLWAELRAAVTASLDGLRSR